MTYRYHSEDPIKRNKLTLTEDQLHDLKCYFIEDYIYPDKSPTEMSLIWILCVLLIVGIPYFSHKIEKYLDKEKKD